MTKREVFYLLIVICFFATIGYNILMMNQSIDGLKKENDWLSEKYNILLIEIISNDLEIKDMKLRQINSERQMLEFGAENNLFKKVKK